ncbi:DUF1223 domain-containing protein [Devosia sp.]|uniref:DUF1223 domain-containing protein n=1 Tax=Devosia sp. TaxID=1871048 RepID=UPI003A95DDE1
MSLRLFIGTLVLPLLLAPASMAAELRLEPRAVVELFTSQGCSSCPKADAMLDQLGQRQDIVALAYHVDYWDYIGWKDTFGHADNSELQRDYAAAWGSSRIYTPQMVVNGSTNVVGSKSHDVDAALGKASLPLEMTLNEHDNMIEVEIPADPNLPDAVVWLVTFIDRAEVEIDRGENRGRTLAYTQIVTGRQLLGMWDGADGAHLKLPVSEVLTGDTNGAVIMVQQESDGLPGPILGAASITH